VASWAVVVMRMYARLVAECAVLVSMMRVE